MICKQEFLCPLVTRRGFERLDEVPAGLVTLAAAQRRFGERRERLGRVGRTGIDRGLQFTKRDGHVLPREGELAECGVRGGIERVDLDQPLGGTLAQRGVLGRPRLGDQLPQRLGGGVVDVEHLLHVPSRRDGIVLTQRGGHEQPPWARVSGGEGHQRGRAIQDAAGRGEIAEAQQRRGRHHLHAEVAGVLVGKGGPIGGGRGTPR